MVVKVADYRRHSMLKPSARLLDGPLSFRLNLPGHTPMSPFTALRLGTMTVIFADINNDLKHVYILNTKQKTKQTLTGL